MLRILFFLSFFITNLSLVIEEYPNIIVSVEVIDEDTKTIIDSVDCTLLINFELEYCQPFDIKQQEARLEFFEKELEKASDEERIKWKERIEHQIFFIEDINKKKIALSKPYEDSFYSPQRKFISMIHPVKNYTITVNHKDYETKTISSKIDCFGGRILIEMKRKN